MFCLVYARTFTVFKKIEIIFSRIALKDIFAMLKVRDRDLINLHQ